MNRLDAAVVQLGKCFSVGKRHLVLVYTEMTVRVFICSVCGGKKITVVCAAEDLFIVFRSE